MDIKSINATLASKGCPIFDVWDEEYSSKESHVYFYIEGPDSVYYPSGDSWVENRLAIDVGFYDIEPVIEHSDGQWEGDDSPYSGGWYEKPGDYVTSVNYTTDVKLTFIEDLDNMPAESNPRIPVEKFAEYLQLDVNKLNETLKEIEACAKEKFENWYTANVTTLDECVTSGEFQRMAPAKVVSMQTMCPSKKAIGKKNKHNKLGEGRKSKKFNEAFTDEELDMDETEWIEKMKAQRAAERQARQERRDAEEKAKKSAEEREARLARGEYTEEEKANNIKQNCKLLSQYIQTLEDDLWNAFKWMASPLSIDLGNPVGYQPYLGSPTWQSFNTIEMYVEGVTSEIEDEEEITERACHEIDYSSGTCTYCPVFTLEDLKFNYLSDYASTGDRFHSGSKNKEAFKQAFVEGTLVFEDTADIHNQLDGDAELFGTIEGIIYESFGFILAAAAVAESHNIEEAAKNFFSTNWAEGKGYNKEIFSQYAYPFYLSETINSYRNSVTESKTTKKRGKDNMKATGKRGLKESEYDDDFNYENELRDVEDGGYDYLYDDESLSYVNPERARYVKDQASSLGMSELEYSSKEEALDKLYRDNRDIYEIETSPFGDFLVDDNGEPAANDAQNVYDLIIDEGVGAYGSPIESPADALRAVLEGYDDCIYNDTPYHCVRDALDEMKDYINNPICEHTRGYYKAILEYMDQYNTLCDAVGYPDMKFDISMYPRNTTTTVKESAKRRRTVRESIISVECPDCGELCDQEELVTWGHCYKCEKLKGDMVYFGDGPYDMGDVYD